MEQGWKSVWWLPYWFELLTYFIQCCNIPFRQWTNEQNIVPPEKYSSFKYALVYFQDKNS